MTSRGQNPNTMSFDELLAHMESMLHRLREEHELEITELKDTTHRMCVPAGVATKVLGDDRVASFRDRHSATMRKVSGRAGGEDGVVDRDYLQSPLIGKSVFVEIMSARNLSSALCQELSVVCALHGDSRLIAKIHRGDMRGSRTHVTCDGSVFREVDQNSNLIFYVYDGDEPSSKTLLGATTLSSSQFHSSGFAGEVDLVDEAGSPISTIEVAVQVHQFERTRSSLPPSITAETSETSVVEIASASSLDYQVRQNLLYSGGDVELVELLLAKANPNALFPDVKCFGKLFKECTPLATAVLKARKAALHLLIEHNADPNSLYAFEAGAEGILWQGTAMHAAVPANRIDIIETLFSLHADIEAPASNGATVLWNAAYMGKVDIVQFLLGKSVNIEARAESQDDHLRTYTPLHAATKFGQLDVLKLLLAAAAQVVVEDGQSFEPIDDAIDQGESEIAKLLVENSANLFGLKKLTVAQRESNSTIARLSMWTAAHNTKTVRGIDLLFSRRNPVIIAAVADGLIKAPTSLERLSKADLVNFLQTPGASARNILNSIIQPYIVHYWAVDEMTGLKRRYRKVTSYINDDTMMNVVVGPHKDHLKNRFNSKETVTDDELCFLDTLAPESERDGHKIVVPAKLMMCHIAKIHQDIEVLLALITHPKDDIMSHQGCEALMQFVWVQVLWTARLSTCISFVEVLNLLLINGVLNFNTCCEDSGNEGPLCDVSTCGDVAEILLSTSNYLALIVWIVGEVMTLGEWVGLSQQGLTKVWMRSSATAFNFLVDTMTIALITACFYWGFQLKQIPGIRLVLGIVVFIKWMRFVSSLCQWKAVGLRILPLVTALSDIGPFSAVLCVWFLGAWNLYWALGLQDVWESFYQIFYLVILGEADLDALIAGKPKYTLLVQAIVIFLAFTMHMGLLSIFVAVLSKSYDLAANQAAAVYRRYRGRRSLAHKAMQDGLKHCCRRRRLRHHQQQQRLASKISTILPAIILGEDDMEDEVTLGSHDYMWICCEQTAK
eukprot:TRINITY_DN88843_c0_g1_i1.p1 TRINITY_DN88843_c0_g1~~TRINITY_DN88843_c0_g1_i1.p1  ORF type:complete len:1012 (+),score=168.07 TRINITY_DN88843_c0_g1_i1:95-3130(+)